MSAPVSGIAHAHARVAQIESQLGVRRPAAAPAASSAAPVDFDDLLSQVTGAAAPVDGGPTGSSPVSVALERLAAGPAATHEARRPEPTAYDHLFEAAGARHGVDPALLRAVASVESGFDPTAVSHAGAQGLMQLMPATADGLGVADPFDPEQAVDGAARLLRSHLDRFGRVDLALAAYNAGPGAVSRHGGIPPYAETQRYVPKVLADYQEASR